MENENIRKILLITGLILLVFGIGIMVFVDIVYSNESNNSNRTLWVIMVIQMPVWISLIIASNQNRKKKETPKANNVYQSEDAGYFADNIISNEGEIIGNDDIT